MTPEDLVNRVCAHHGVTPSELRSSKRHRRIANARAEAAWLLRETFTPKVSFPEIGRLLNKDHTSVMAACANVEGRVQHVDGYLERLDEIVHGSRRALPLSLRAAVKAHRRAFVLEAA